MRLLLLAGKIKAAPFQSILRQERIYYDLLHRVAFIEHPPFSRRTYNGVLLDEALIEHCSPDDKAKLELLKKVLPCHIIHSNATPSQNLDLFTFFKSCQYFPARSIRHQRRTDINLSALVSTDADFGVPRDAIALNISRNGCFLTSPLRQVIGDNLWLSLDGLEDSSPLRSEIRWFSQETRAELPLGMGVRFLEASSSQIEQLEWLMQGDAISP